MGADTCRVEFSSWLVMALAVGRVHYSIIASSHEPETNTGAGGTGMP